MAPKLSEALVNFRKILTLREWQVLTLVLEGKGSNEISRELGIGQETARRHIGRLTAKIRRKGVLEGFDAHVTGLSTTSIEEPNSLASTQITDSKKSPLDHLRRHLQALVPLLYAQVLEPTLADLRQEHSAALAEGCPAKARWILLQGCIALAAAAVLQLGSSLLSRIAALWQARSSK